MFKGRTAAVLSLILCLAFFSTLMRGRIQTSAVSGSVMGRRPTVILDAGHGGFDGGAVASDGTVEKEINLKIALKLKEFLRLGGYEVVMTRDSDVSTDDVETDKIAARKKSDLKNRLKLMKDYPDAVFVSIHLNKFTTSAAAGSQVFYGAVEVAAASILYMILPQSRRLSNLFTAHGDRLPGDSLRKNVILRLRYTAEAMRSASDSVDRISEKLETTAAADLPHVYGRAAEKVCTGCSQCAVCWRKNRDETQKTFSRLSYPLRERGKIERSDFDVPFLTRCNRAMELRDAVNGEYRELLAKESARMRAEQVRAIVEEHFRSTAQMLGDMAEEFEQYQRFDEDSAEQVREVLRHRELTPIEVCCRIDKFGRMTIEANICRTHGVHINKGQLTREISGACGRTFTQPSVTAAGDTLKLQMCQKPVYAVQRGFAQHAANGASLCGDCAEAFTDGNGRYISVLSDGMGTGGRAAVDGTMTAGMAQSLLKAGIGFESTLKMINSAMLAKGGEESLATLDVACIDLFTGHVSLRKAGAAGTVLRRRKKTEYLEAKSVPVGILPEIAFARSEKDLDAGDMLVMVSDGVTASGTEWLCDLIANYEDDDPQALSERIVERAVKDRADGHEDDVSAVVLLIE